jgi:hypothetical protein
VQLLVPDPCRPSCALQGKQTTGCSMYPCNVKEHAASSCRARRPLDHSPPPPNTHTTDTLVPCCCPLRCSLMLSTRCPARSGPSVRRRAWPTSPRRGTPSCSTGGGSALAAAMGVGLSCLLLLRVSEACPSALLCIHPASPPHIRPCAHLAGCIGPSRCRRRPGCLHVRP